MFYKWLESYNLRYLNYTDFLYDKYIMCDTLKDAFFYYFAIVQWIVETSLINAFMFIVYRSRRKRFKKDLQSIIDLIAKSAHLKNREIYDFIFGCLEDLKNDLQTNEDVKKLLFVADYANKLYFDKQAV